MNIRQFLAVAALTAASFAQAEVVLVIHPGSGISSMSQSQVSRLFFGQTDLLPNGNKALPMDVSGPSKDAFAKEILKKSPEQVEKYWARMIFTGKAKPPREVKAGDVRAAVAQTPGAISYLDRSQVDGSVKIVTITP